MEDYATTTFVPDDAFWERINTRKRRETIRIADSQWWLCHYCDLPMTLEALTRDHVRPKARGGRSNRKNLVACCTGCNKSKADGKLPSPHYIRGRQIQYYSEMGLYATKPRGKWRVLFPGFGTDLEGKPLQARQFGIV